MILDDNGCPCSGRPHPPLPSIAPNQQRLAARQLLGFHDIRYVLLARLNSHDALDGWRADPTQQVQRDLGVMLLDFAAYVLAVTGFYDARIAERSYLTTAPDAETLQELVALIGYEPRPAMAATVRLALEAAGHDPVALPSGVAFRSEAFDEERPQIFETLTDQTIWPGRNRWALEPIPEPLFNGTLLFGEGAVPHQGAMLVVADHAFSQAASGRVVSVRPETTSKGPRFRRVVLDDSAEHGLEALEGQQLTDLRAYILRQHASGTPYSHSPLSIIGKTVTMDLDAVYGQIRRGDPVALETAAGRFVGRITDLDVVPQSVTTLINGENVNSGVLQSRVTAELLTQPEDLARPRLYFDAVPMGQLRGHAKESVTPHDLSGGAGIIGPIAALGDAPGFGAAMLQGARRGGTEMDATISRRPDRSGLLTPADSAGDFTPALAQPVQAFGNVIEAVRGETVTNEVLGSSDGRTAFQRFALKKKPLCWITDPASPIGRRPFIEVAIDGITWTYARHLAAHGPEARVFALIARADGRTELVFGDGQNGAIPPSGVGNIVALSYRYGGGAAKPPPGAITQFKRPVRGINRIHSPLSATGGADAETPEEVRRTAPDFALTLDRAVSLLDFEAMARAYTGILNAHAEWVWQAGRQRAAIAITVIPDRGDPSADLEAYLEARAAPGAMVEIRKAVGDTRLLTIDLQTKSDHVAADVASAVHRILFDELTGFLAPRNIRIGSPLLRSHLTQRLHAVAGVAAVRALRFDGQDMPAALLPAPGTDWIDVVNTTSIGVS